MNRTRVLIVEDEIIIAKNMKRRLEMLGCDVVGLVTSGEEAVEVAVETRPDVVLMDILLSGEMDGVEAAAQIRARCDVPIIYLSAYRDETILQRVAVSEPFGYISKPCRDQELQTSIAIALYKHEQERKVRESELRFRSLIEYTTDAVFCYEYDPPIPTNLPIEEQVPLFYEGVLVECNDVAARSYGATRAQEVVGKELTDLFGTVPGSLDDFFGAFIQNDYRTVDAEGTEVLSDGTERYFLNNGHGVIENGALLRVWGTFRDITERKRATQALQKARDELEAQVEQRTRALRDSEERLELALRGADLATWDSNLQTGAVRFNPRWAELLGYTLEEIEPHVGAWERLLHPDDLEQAMATLNENLEGSTSFYESEHRLRAKSGEWRWVLARGQVVERDADGAPLRHAGTYLDITERKRAEEELWAHRDHLEELVRERTAELEKEIAERKQAEGELGLEKGFSEKILDAVIDTIFVFDPSSGRSIRWNRAFSEISGYTDEEIADKKAPDDWYPEEDIEKTRMESERLLRGEKSIVEMSLITKDGRLIPTEYTASMTHDPEGNPQYIIAVGRDVSERRRGEEALRATLREREALLAEIHHRVKNNLQVVSSLLDFQIDYVQNEQAIEALRDSKQRIRSMALVHDRLYGAPDLARIDFADYVNGLTADLFSVYRASPVSIALQLDVEGVSLPVKQAITCGLLVNELASNALKHAFPDGDREAAEICVALHEEGHTITLTMSDNGAGLPPDFQFPSEETLGMLLIETFVEQLEGTIEWQGDGGTTCRVVFAVSEE
jgi:PAS domain S-box-containing protein